MFLVASHTGQTRHGGGFFWLWHASGPGDGILLCLLSPAPSVAMTSPCIINECKRSHLLKLHFFTVPYVSFCLPWQARHRSRERGAVVSPVAAYHLPHGDMQLNLWKPLESQDADSFVIAKSLPGPKWDLLNTFLIQKLIW